MTEDQYDQAVEQLAQALNDLFSTINMLSTQRGLGYGTPRTLRNPRSLLAAITPYAERLEDIRQNPHQDLNEAQLKSLAGKARLLYPTRLTEDGYDDANDPIGADRGYDDLLAGLEATQDKWPRVLAHAAFVACLSAEIKQGYA